jgi:ectoine hydroxylase-related dioxygenase (phytanoyl-CoA dioxygenase family)
MFLTPAAFDCDGCFLAENLFRADEVAAMIRDVESGTRVATTTHGVADASSKAAKLAIWSDLGNDIWAAASTCPPIVRNIEVLLRDVACFFHSKVMLKEARSSGAWEWHQDYGYWYQDGDVFPRLMSAFVALDEATRENGCLQVLRGSQKLGRLEHSVIDAQQGSNVSRTTQVEDLFERVYCMMKPGSVLFFDCNLLHVSSPNESDFHRRAFIICYNAQSNPILRGDEVIYNSPCPISGDAAIMKFA